MIEAVSLFMGLSLWLYCLLGGADFGAGILEAFSSPAERSRHRKLVNHAIGPVWEVNHIWLILALVICFNAFPLAFGQVSITFHIPLTLMLFGIVLRGCAFTFRHYDAYRDQSQIYYSRVFTLSSILTPFSIGLVVGGLIGGRINPHAGSFYGAYVEPWFNPLSFSLAIFVCCQFTFLAAAYMVGEASDPLMKTRLIQRAKRWNLAAIFSGGLVFVIGWLSGAELFETFLSSAFSLFTVALATLLIVPGWIALNERATWIPRVVVGSQFTLILLGWTHAQYPYIIPPSPRFGYAGLTLAEQGLSGATMVPLLTALGVGATLVFPALFYLIRTLKLK